MKTKKASSLLLIAGLILFGSADVSAQKWLDKALKSVDKALSTVDNTVNKGLNAVDGVLGNPTEQPSKMAGYETASIKSFSTNVDFTLESCINDGKTLTISYYLTNRGKELDIRQFGAAVNSFSDKKEKTLLLDDLGNEYEVVFNAVGKTSTASNQSIGFILPEGVKLKGEIRLANFNSRAKTLQLVNIVGCIYDNTHKNSNNPTSPEYTPFNLTLRNVPVYTSQQILNASKTLFTKEMPQVESQTEKNSVIKSVVVTANNTQINIRLTNLTGYNFIYMDNNKPAFLTVGGKKYPLMAYYGICSDKDLSYKYYNTSKNPTLDFTFVFEKIPETNLLSLTWDDWSWNNIWLVDPPKTGLSAIPETKGILSLDDMYNQHDNRKRITAAERTALKINSIKNGGFDTKWLNSQLSKGKEIYSGKEGKLLTILYIEKDQAVAEYLVSYNAAGNVVDCLNIANISAYGGDRGEGIIKGDWVTVYSSYEDVTDYQMYGITPELKFRKWNRMLEDWEDEIKG